MTIGVRGWRDSSKCFPLLHVVYLEGHMRDGLVDIVSGFWIVSTNQIKLKAGIQ